MKYNLFKSKADWEDYIRTGILSTNIEPFFKKTEKLLILKAKMMNTIFTFYLVLSMNNLILTVYQRELFTLSFCFFVFIKHYSIAIF
jgi:hypothetical protein